MPIKLHAIYRYPIKALGPETLQEVTLAQEGAMPGDRRFALARPEHATTTADWLPKRAFMALDSFPALAGVDVQRDADGHTLRLYQNGRLLGAGNPDNEAGRDTLASAIGKVLDGGLPTGARVVGTTASRFTDARQALLSIVCQASALDLSEMIRQDMPLRRFRSNLVLSGGMPWQEMDWIGETLDFGELKLRVVEPIVRCAATRANPASGLADLDVLRPLARLLGEAVFGVYAEVLSAGTIRCGDTVDTPTGGGRFRTRSALGM